MEDWGWLPLLALSLGGVKHRGGDKETKFLHSVKIAVRVSKIRGAVVVPLASFDLVILDSVRKREGVGFYNIYPGMMCYYLM